MPAIGITGGISTGKTSFCECLHEVLPAAAKFFDADQAAHELVELDPDVRKELVAEFGREIFSRDGRLKRERLRAVVFKNAAKRRALEQILHPRIRRQWSAEAATHRNSPDFFFANIPLLYETGGEALCDRVVVVACSPTIQLARLLLRKGITRGAAKEMIKSQMRLEEKITRADHVVWNNGERSVLAEQARSLVELWCQEKWAKAGAS
ncbi:MAG: dephospho-CoA kinase [Chthoniobacterales bacterium]